MAGSYIKIHQPLGVVIGHTLQGPSSEEAQSSIEAVESLQNYLVAHYEMPSESWWEEEAVAFSELQSYFQQGHLSFPAHDHVPEVSSQNLTLTQRHGSEQSPTLTPSQQEVNASEDLTTNEARFSATPVVSLLKTGLHLARLGALSDELSCLAFGTISSGLFFDVFWEIIARIGEQVGTNIVVFEASDPTSDLFRFSYNGYRYRMFYFHSADLLRKYPRVSDMPMSFLENGGLDAAAKSALITYHESTKSSMTFNNRNFRLGYYSIRALELENLCFSDISNVKDYITPKTIVQVLGKHYDRGVLNNESSLCNIVRCWVSPGLSFSALQKSENLDENAVDFGDRAISIIKLLSMLHNMSLHQRLKHPRYLLISLIWSGASQLQGSEWLKMVDQKVKELRQKLNILLSQINFRPYLVPSRLISLAKDQISEATTCFYEGYHVLGLPNLTTSENLYGQVTRAVDDWAHKVSQDNPECNDKGFIRVEYRSAEEMSTERFVRCTRHWPETSLTSPEAEYRMTLVPSHDEGFSSSSPHHTQQLRSDYHSRHQSQAPSNNSISLSTAASQSSPLPSENAPLRPASHVLNRLRHDPNYLIDEWVVGHLDRHSNYAQEKPAAKWEAETTHDDFIPEHRIVYFKRLRPGGWKRGGDDDGDEIWWDRATRRDRIFGSGSGG